MDSPALNGTQSARSPSCPVLGGRTGAILGYRVQGTARPSGGSCHPVQLNTDPNCHFDQGLNRAINKLREALGDSAENPIFIETLAKRGYRFIGSLAVTARRIASLAVLPLDNLSRDPEQEFLADGMTEALITNLAKVGALRIASRTSVMRFKGTRNKSIREVAAELGVDGIVEGTVSRDRDRVRISAQLMMRRPTRTSGLRATSESSSLSSPCRVRSRAASSK